MNHFRAFLASTNESGTSGKPTPHTGLHIPNVLTPTQQRFLLNFFGEDVRGCREVYLSGGTALAGYYLFHRYSDDLDFFVRDESDLEAIDLHIRRTTEKTELQLEGSDIRSMGIQYQLSGDPHPSHPLVKVEVMVDSPPHFAPPRRFDGVLVDDLLCIGVNKTSIISRIEPKDYIDLFTIIRSGRIPKENLVPLAKQKVVGLDELTIAGHFLEVERLPDLTRFQEDYLLIDVRRDELVRFYKDWAAELFAAVGPGRGD